MLRFAFFRGFKPEPTILFWGGREDVSEFSKILREPSIARRNFKLSQDQRFLSVDGSQITLEWAERGTGMRREANSPFHYHWILDGEWAEEIAEKLDALSRAGAGHQYLEGWRAGEIPVMVSIGEYPEDLVP
ncbi:MAG TPA: hypothetical protein VEU95_04850 [Micropepsaceae bacterium]|nr:hypothetical protein [Micropepsaceae bacterium]